MSFIIAELQGFSCQDKLRTDSANDFLRAASYCQQCKMNDNAKLALSYFVSTIAVGEEFQRFKGLPASVLVEAIEISRLVRLFWIYLLALIERGDWQTGRKLIQNAITTLDKSVHCHI